jgi:hypothetical protein
MAGEHAGAGVVEPVGKHASGVQIDATVKCVGAVEEPLKVTPARPAGALGRSTAETREVKRSLWWLVSVGAVSLAALIMLYLQHRALLRIDKATCDQVHRGMTRAEVEAILGGPPGNYTGLFFNRDIAVPLTVVGSASRSQWTGTHGVLIVFFDEQEDVLTSTYFPPP